ncbi:DUF3331 domain-containing protein [Paraburkholderia sp. Tr-20389]|uniref:DUF3331 domain-containing protein n=1 Tax=Paraburkholderia sp. Tr-20389 TaxID=2703903 RepID=UPI00197D69F9|nr:DUF3331 domain-containing protein [Paraburkholderia sp. Tr-20389]MBN3754432.1 DUF3331 domain-containing protein [Paraburkholderia sp. Tr-20389]
MNALSKDNIVVRTLLNVLDPSAEQRHACTKNRYAALKKLRVTIPSPVSAERSVQQTKPAHIVVQERLSSCTISVSWSDPCSGRYTEQIWRSGLARDAAVCVLTGRAISRGDPVFRPRAHDFHVPSNQHQMILAATVDQHAGLTVA